MIKRLNELKPAMQAYAVNPLNDLDDKLCARLQNFKFWGALDRVATLLQQMDHTIRKSEGNVDPIIASSGAVGKLDERWRYLCTDAHTLAYHLDPKYVESQQVDNSPQIFMSRVGNYGSGTPHDLLKEFSSYSGFVDSFAKDQPIWHLKDDALAFWTLVVSKRRARLRTDKVNKLAFLYTLPAKLEVCGIRKRVPNYVDFAVTHMSEHGKKARELKRTNGHSSQSTSQASAQSSSQPTTRSAASSAVSRLPLVDDAAHNDDDEVPDNGDYMHGINFEPLVPDAYILALINAGHAFSNFGQFEPTGFPDQMGNIDRSNEGSDEVDEDEDPDLGEPGSEVRAQFGVDAPLDNDEDSSDDENDKDAHAGDDQAGDGNTSPPPPGPDDGPDPNNGTPSPGPGPNHGPDAEDSQYDIPPHEPGSFEGAQAVEQLTYTPENHKLFEFVNHTLQHQWTRDAFSNFFTLAVVQESNLGNNLSTNQKTAKRKVGKLLGPLYEVQRIPVAGLSEPLPYVKLASIVQFWFWHPILSHKITEINQQFTEPLLRDGISNLSTAEIKTYYSERFPIKSSAATGYMWAQSMAETRDLWKPRAHEECRMIPESVVKFSQGSGKYGHVFETPTEQFERIRKNHYV
ncbi:hypothetical protein DFS34DRAFT_694992 [Phlyctochytrium arcticum]|nr:hypothetical protein DFS34DRAFT_694992 [Phlyctochytrium arcticum]